MTRYYVIKQIGHALQPMYCSNYVGTMTKDIFSARMFLDKKEAKEYILLHYDNKENATLIIEKLYCTYKD
jgi:hypothetical protein